MVIIDHIAPNNQLWDVPGNVGGGLLSIEETEGLTAEEIMDLEKKRLEEKKKEEYLEHLAKVVSGAHHVMKDVLVEASIQYTINQNGNISTNTYNYMNPSMSEYTGNIEYNNVANNGMIGYQSMNFNSNSNNMMFNPGLSMNDPSYAIECLENNPDLSIPENQRKAQLVDLYIQKQHFLQREMYIVNMKIQEMSQDYSEQKTHLKPDKLASKASKKLAKETYDALYQYMLENEEGRDKYYRSSHITVENINDLAGEVYFLHANKNTKKPPSVGHKFRSYGDHYTSLDRENPISCKVKIWQDASDSTKVWRMYHFYRGYNRHKK
eukprot:TRINITY_DN8819_c0_g2_i2.p2 TRINITY_DN8819_c0_g2~~TRINITY_DN8819_c0_g2_i2.p2  ORF type:complete len:323 (-),score=63.59 TRINITY_DN8819_c0_g2_i2:1335-2303(-)